MTLDPTNLGHFPISEENAVHRWDKTFAGWAIPGESVSPVKIITKPMDFRLKLTGQSFVLRRVAFSQLLTIGMVRKEGGTRYSSAGMPAFPLGKDFLGKGTALAVYLWPGVRHIIFKVANPDDTVYRYYAITEDPQ